MGTQQLMIDYNETMHNIYIILMQTSNIRRAKFQFLVLQLPLQSIEARS